MTAQAAETIRIEVESRWDAVDLVRRLSGLHTYLVQLADSRWIVCVRQSDGADVLPLVRAAAVDWAQQRHVDSVVRVGGAEFPIPG